MPNLPLPTGESNLTGGDVPVSSEEDVLAEFPRKIRTASVAPVRDGIVAGFTEGFKAYQNIAARAAAQCDPMRATGDCLKSFAEERQVIPGRNESEESVRARLFLAPQCVTPEAIRSGVNKLLESYTDKQCTVSELDLDGWFVHDGTAVWDSFIGADPEYPDRYYEDLPYRKPGGAVPSWRYPRSFLMRIPPLEANNSNIAYVLDSNAGIFVGDDTGAAGVAWFAFENPKTAEELYSTIVGLVSTVKGQGISWSLVVDPTL